MLTYEQITSQILDSMKDAGINPYLIRHKLELVTLMKEFECLCVVKNKKSPYITRAEISFSWESIMTAESIYGGDCCALFHDETEDCLHDDENREAVLELEIKYNIEAKEEFKEETNLINTELLTVINAVMEHQNKPQITWVITLNNNGAHFISDVKLQHYWNIEIKDEDLELTEIFEEVHEMLVNIDRLPFVKDEF
ncbi:hypothetical protein EV586_10944 [Tumebacillus sp. BK434]|uniref:hypothetical protein n=1 Tax=Tumebacillus sp. BK434 TaxID=2512169 RepID=UPI00104EF9B5|nr:hypothetical protein [Tumebacillus sp. BK434]TCP52563.1 hypothetical protein EV586_10944 [Tumebacillus sp. BK434]